jgi:Tol biopolymer transport system component
VFQDPKGWLAISPTWSPDGRRIAFESHDQICTMHPDGSALKTLTRFSGEELASDSAVPVWSPDGRRIAFFRTPRLPEWNTRELWVMSSNGSHLRHPYSQPTYQVGPYGPVWSPDGKYIAFDSEHKPARKWPLDAWQEIYVIDSNGGHLHLLQNSAVGPAWQPAQ